MRPQNELHICMCIYVLCVCVLLTLVISCSNCVTGSALERKRQEFLSGRRVCHLKASVGALWKDTGTPHASPAGCCWAAGSAWHFGNLHRGQQWCDVTLSVLTLRQAPCATPRTRAACLRQILLMCLMTSVCCPTQDTCKSEVDAVITTAEWCR
jgi:hypothetical protein